MLDLAGSRWISLDLAGSRWISLDRGGQCRLGTQRPGGPTLRGPGGSSPPRRPSRLSLPSPLDPLRLSRRTPGTALRPRPRSCRTGSALVGRVVLFRWPTDGWVHGTVARLSRAAGFSHVVRYGPRSALGAAASGCLDPPCRFARPGVLGRSGGPCSVQRATRGPACGFVGLRARAARAALKTLHP